MNPKNFRINLIIRTLILVGSAFGLAYMVLNTQYYVVTFITTLVILGILIDFIRYMDKTNRDLTGFLMAIQHDDFSTTFTETSKGKTFRNLYGELNEITRQFQRIRAEKEVQFQYLQTIVEHVNVGLLCVDENGKVLLMNEALQHYLHKPYVQHLNSLKQTSPSFVQTINEIKAGEKKLLKLEIGNDQLTLSVAATEFKLQDVPHKLISVQNIRSELETQEEQAWQKLIRILTHEIMNSVTPVVSLTGTIREMLREEEAFDREETLEDAREGLKAIEKRSKGLLHFTQAYRNLMQIPPPRFLEVDTSQLLDRTLTLFKAELSKHQIKYEMDLPPMPIIIQADPELLEQVMINLIKNALDALKGRPNPRLKMGIRKTAITKAQIYVSDNGPGIPEKVQEKIFVPFFTTKTEGSGIGLSLCRQIMQMHKGHISMRSEEEVGTIFMLEF
ncbi:MAG: PAS domain-containing protein [Bacteroidetes bacterium]|nr:PAS domain-containing protein [Bacteroidota bacterium]